MKTFDPDKPLRLRFTEDCDGTGTWGLVWDCPTLGREMALVTFFWPCHGPEVPESEIDEYYRIMGHTFAEAMDKENVTRDALRAAEAEIERLKAEIQHLKAHECPHGPSGVVFKTALDDLRKHEGESVTIHSDNADFGGPNCAIDVVGEWTGWEARRFTGDTVFAALRAAIRVRNIQETL